MAHDGHHGRAGHTFGGNAFFSRSSFDELTRLEMNDLLLDIRRVTGATVIFVTHSISEAVYLSDRVFVFSKRPAGTCKGMVPRLIK